MDRIIQAPRHGTVGGGESEGDLQVYNHLPSRMLVPQETYKPPRQQREVEGPRAIEFFARGQRGIRLFDALEGNWTGFDGRDDRHLFEEGRLTIIVRMQVSFRRSFAFRS